MVFLSMYLPLIKRSHHVCTSKQHEWSTFGSISIISVYLNLKAIRKATAIRSILASDRCLSKVKWTFV